MSSKADFFLKKSLGDDFFESLQKFELWKPGTRTTIDHEEIGTALHIVPRTIMALLIRELAPMKINDNKDVTIPSDAPTVLKVTKHERDVYTGHIEQNNKIIVDFKYRSIPGIGLVIMSALELYNVDELHKVPTPEPDVTDKVQKLIDERLALHDLVNRVVERKLQEKDAIQQLLLARLSEVVNPAPQPVVVVIEKKEPEQKSKKVSPLGGFLDSRKTKPKPKEFSIELAKGEHVNCPDCGSSIFNGELFSGCICLGDDMSKKVFLKKTEEGIKVRFSKGWDQENIEMLLEILRKKNG